MIKVFCVNPFQENTYVFSDESGECVIVDCGVFYPEERTALVRYIKDNNLIVKHLLCTHGHVDHCIGNDTVYNEFGVKPELHADDERMLKMLPQQADVLMGYQMKEEMPPVGRFFREGTEISFGSRTLQVLHTPGHTPGGAVYYCEQDKLAFTGDTLFKLSVGRTDFWGGSFEALHNSLQKLISTLPADTTLYPGHGSPTTLAFEMSNNPYLR